MHDILLQLMKILFIDAEDPDTLIYNELLEAEEEETHKVPHQRAELKSKMVKNIYIMYIKYISI